jgi:hypothetical protein
VSPPPDKRGEAEAARNALAATVCVLERCTQHMHSTLHVCSDGHTVSHPRNCNRTHMHAHHPSYVMCGCDGVRGGGSQCTQG